MGGGMGGGQNPFASMGGGGQSPFGPASSNAKPIEIIKPLACTLTELYCGVTKKLKITKLAGESEVVTVVVKPGYKDGTKIKFAGAGGTDESGRKDISFVISSEFSSPSVRSLIRLTANILNSQSRSKLHFHSIERQFGSYRQSSFGSSFDWSNSTCYLYTVSLFTLPFTTSSDAPHPDKSNLSMVELFDSIFLIHQLQEVDQYDLEWKSKL